MKKIIAIAAAALAVGSAAFALWDTSTYRNAVATFAERYPSEQIKAETRALGAEIQTVMGCYKRKPIVQLSADGHACLVSALPKIRTWEVALSASVAVSSWLLLHPDDEQLRNAALVALDNGRSTLAKEKPKMDLLQTIAEAKDNSIILRLTSGKRAGPDLFVLAVERLNQAEYSVRLPDVAQSHREFLRRAHVGIEKP